MSTDTKKENGLIVYSSKTGNTRKLALAAAAKLGQPVSVIPVEENPVASQYPWVIVGFWVDRGTADAKALDYIKTLTGAKVGLIGTIGAYPDSKHAEDVKQRVTELVQEKNTVLGCFLSQGKIDPALTEKFKDLPPDHPHAMNEERRKRHEIAAKHPDENDFTACAAACTQMILAAGTA